MYTVVKNLMFVCLLMVATVTAQDSSTSGQAKFLSQFVQGTYQLIGQQPDNTVLYRGTVYLLDSNRVKRAINNRVIWGTWQVEFSGADKTPVLRCRFTDNHIAYETTYLINGDLDNYARLSGYLYRRDGKTVQPGLESLFYLHSAD